MVMDVMVTVLTLALLGFTLLRCAGQWGLEIPLPCLKRSGAAVPDSLEPSAAQGKIADWKTFLWALSLRLAVLGALLLCAMLAAKEPVEPATLWDKLHLWDARHYANLVEKGYTAYEEDGRHIFLVFFPAYVWLTRLARFIIPNTIAAGVTVSSVCFSLGCCYVHRLARALYNESVARDAVLFLSCFPFSFFYGTMMTEGLFLLATAGAVYYALRRKWLLYGLFGALAALTRMTGVLVVAFAGLELLRDYQPLKTPVLASLKRALPAILKRLPLVLLPFLGTLCYLWLNYHVDGDPMAFVRHQEHWHQGGMWVSHVVRYMSDYLGRHLTESSGWAIWAPSLALFVGGMAVLGLSTVREESSPALVAFTSLYFVANFSLSWLLSAGRYLSCGFGLFILLAALLRSHEHLRAAFTVISSLLMGIYLYAYVTGAQVM